MSEPIDLSTTPAEYFRELVTQALVSQHVECAEFTDYYLVNMLCNFMRPFRDAWGDVLDSTFVTLLTRAQNEQKFERRERLRHLGDFTLVVSGFFPDWINARRIDHDYYVAMGSYAYGCLAQNAGDVYCEVFADLSSKFVAYVDVLSDINTRIRIDSKTDLLRLFDHYLRTGSQKSLRELLELGQLPAHRPNPTKQH